MASEGVDGASVRFWWSFYRLARGRPMADCFLCQACIGIVSHQ